LHLTANARPGGRRRRRRKRRRRRRSGRSAQGQRGSVSRHGKRWQPPIMATGDVAIPSFLPTFLVRPGIKPCRDAEYFG
jgi:ribosomal protein L15